MNERKMSLENLNCPQFVDFTSGDIIDINDGADYIFEKGVVGELNQNLLQIQREEDRRDSVEELFAALSNVTNIKHVKPTLKKAESEDKKKEAPPTTTTTVAPVVVSNENTKQQLNNGQPLVNKENQSKQMGVVASTCLDSAVSSAIELMAAASISKDTTTTTTTTTTLTTKYEETRTVTKITANLNAKKKETSKQTLTPQFQNRPRTNSANSNVSSSSTPAAQHNKIISHTNQPNIVKKTFAKMTAAFKTTKPIVESGGELKGKLAAKKAARTNSNTTPSQPMKGPVKAENKKGARKTTNDPIEIQTGVLISGDAADSNRRCSSVPRTLKEKHAVAKSGIAVPGILRESAGDKEEPAPPSLTSSLGEKIQNFFTGHNGLNSSTGAAKSKQAANATKMKNPILPLKSLVSKNVGQIKLAKYEVLASKEERRRSRSCNESINLKPNAGRHSRRSTKESNESTDSTNPAKSTTTAATTTTTTTTTATKTASSHNQSTNKSENRAITQPLYQGVKFIPKLSHKYQSSNHDNAGTVCPHLPLEEILKSRPVCLQKPQTTTTTIGNKSTNESIRKANSAALTRSGGSFKQQAKPSSATLSSSASFMATVKMRAGANTSLVKPANSEQNLNETNSVLATPDLASQERGRLNNSSKTRKKSETQPQVMGSFLHTEVRALKRHEYDQSMKEKEHLGSLIKQDLEMKALKKQQDEVLKMRHARMFKSNPVKHYKALEVKPSEKPLTEPKTPPLSTSNSRLNSLCRYDSMKCLSTSASALVDAPLVRIRSQSKNSSSIVVENRLKLNGNAARKSALSHDDIRVKY